MNKFFLVLVIFPFVARTQVISDGFSDGDFNHAPQWIGDSGQFIVNSQYQLQLHDVSADNSCLATKSPQTRLWNQEWRFYIRENFSPSAFNNGRVYLVSDQQDLKDSLNGYYLQFGEAGSNDAVELFRQHGTTSVSVCRGINGEIASPFTITVRVIRDSTGTWSLFVDKSAGSNYLLEATGSDTLITTTTYFGVWALYTVSDDTKFYWDDFYAGPIYVDHTLPAILSLQTKGDRQLDLQWNMIPDSGSVHNTGNYYCDQGLGHPISVIQDSATSGRFLLVFPGPFIPNQRYQLSVMGVKNQQGDQMKPDSVIFWRYEPAPFDVVINEIMANPTPPVNLPAYEYIELYNRRKMPISLDNWTITENKKTQLLQGVTIEADSFLLLCSTTGAAAFNPALPVYAVPGFPALNNTGAELTLKTDSGRVMSSVVYADTWYQDASKSNGGWSLEQIDPNNPCGGVDNWKASASRDGGTPCRKNSVNRANPDKKNPMPYRVATVSSDTICLYFNEPLDSSSMMNKALYSIDQGIRVDDIQPVGNDYSSILLHLSVPIQPRIIYTLDVSKGVWDCSGNKQQDDAYLKFGIPQPASPGDVAINELLPDAKSGGEKYIELYNRSQKIMDFKALNIASLDSVTGLITDVKSISTGNYLFFPGDYIVLSKNGNAVKSQYYTSHPDNFIDLPSFPIMDIGGGSLAVLDKSGIVMDQVTYFSSWQFPLLADTKGVALERIDYDKPTQDATNWHSAAETAGFGTPADKNSEWMQEPGLSAISLNDELFSPDEDGYHDVLEIHYHLDSPGYIGNLTIYDSKGTLVRSLMKNELLGEEGCVNWDGITDNRQKAAIGVYLILFDVFGKNGKREGFRKACVLAGKL